MAGARIVLGSGMLATALVACTTFGVAPPQDTTEDDTAIPAAQPRDTGAPIDASTPTIDATAPADAGPARANGHWQGTLSDVSPVTYGGGGACDYTARFNDVTVDVRIQDGVPIDATVTAALTTACTDIVCVLKSESFVGTEPETYTFTPLATQDMNDITLVPAPTNAIQASLVIQGDFTSDESLVTLTWLRSDHPSFMWTVTANIPMVPTP